MKATTVFSIATFFLFAATSYAADEDVLVGLECTRAVAEHREMNELSRADQKKMDKLLAAISSMQASKKIDPEVVNVVKKVIRCANDPAAIYKPAATAGSTKLPEGSIGIMTDPFTPIIRGIVPHSPASKSKLQLGDEILRINGKSYLSPEVIGEKLRGPKGSTVKVLVKRGSKQLTATIKRDIVTLYKIDVGNEAWGNTYKILQFDKESVSFMRNFLRDQQPKAVLIDLRLSIGGELSAIDDALGMFLPKGTEWLTISNNGDYNSRRTVSGALVPRDIPVVILADESTSAGAEVFASALRTHRKAVIIGSQTLGLYNIKQQINFTDGSSVLVTAGTMLDENAKPFTADGILPDVKVTATASSRDVVHSTALKFIEDQLKLSAKRR